MDHNPQEFFWQLHNSSPDSWKKHTDFDNAPSGAVGSLYKKKIDGFPIEFIKTIVTFKNQTIKNYDIVCYHQTNHYKKKLDKCVDLIVVEREGNWPTILYSCFKMPMLITDRESVLKSSRTQLNQNQVFYCVQSTQHPSFPLRSDRIRTNMV